LGVGGSLLVLEVFRGFQTQLFLMEGVVVEFLFFSVDFLFLLV
jgi:hypothetical protein